MMPDMPAELPRRRFSVDIEKRRHTVGSSLFTLRRAYRRWLCRCRRLIISSRAAFIYSFASGCMRIREKRRLARGPSSVDRA